MSVLSKQKICDPLCLSESNYENRNTIFTIDFTIDFTILFRVGSSSYCLASADLSLMAMDNRSELPAQNNQTDLS